MEPVYVSDYTPNLYMMNAALQGAYGVIDNIERQREQARNQRLFEEKLAQQQLAREKMVQDLLTTSEAQRQTGLFAQEASRLPQTATSEDLFRIRAKYPMADDSGIAPYLAQVGTDRRLASREKAEADKLAAEKERRARIAQIITQAQPTGTPWAPTLNQGMSPQQLESSLINEGLDPLNAIRLRKEMMPGQPQEFPLSTGQVLVTKPDGTSTVVTPPVQAGKNDTLNTLRAQYGIVANKLKPLADQRRKIESANYVQLGITAGLKDPAQIEAYRKQKLSELDKLMAPLQSEVDKIQRNMDKHLQDIGGSATEESDAGPKEPTASAPGSPNVVAPNKIIRQGGKTYRFLGGDPKDPKNYQEI